MKANVSGFRAAERWQRTAVALNRDMFAYLFERFPKRSQTFCYGEVEEFYRRGVKPPVFSLRVPEGTDFRNAGIDVHQVPEGKAFAKLADQAATSMPRSAQTTLRAWRGKRDSLRLHQAAYIGLRLRELGITHVHAHFAGMAARTAFWIKEFFGIPYSLTVHANDIFVPNHFELGLPQILSSASAVIAVSDFAADYLRQQFPESGGAVRRIYNGLDLAKFQPTRFSQPPSVLAVGRLISKKGFDVLIDACALAPDCSCEIIGDGPLREVLQARIDRENLSHRVALAGHKSPAEIALRLSEATVFVLPSRMDPDGSMDNLPTVIIEAMASSLPVVSTNVGGIPEMVRDGESGFIVGQNDVAATAEAISRLLVNREMARAFGHRGRERARELFSIEKNARELRNILAP